MMGARIHCVEWSDPVSVLEIARRPDAFTKRGRSTVYLIEHDGEPIYCGCTRLHVAARLLAHRNAKSEAGIYMREMMGQSPTLTVRWCEGSTRLESYVIHALAPMCNKLDPAKSLVPHRVSNAQIKGSHVRAPKLTPEQRAEVRRRGLAGECRRKLAREFDISAPSVTLICNYRPTSRTQKRRRAWLDLVAA